MLSCKLWSILYPLNLHLYQDVEYFHHLRKFLFSLPNQSRTLRQPLFWFLSLWISFACCRTSQRWDFYIVYMFLYLVSFAQHDVFELHPCYYMYQLVSCFFLLICCHKNGQKDALAMSQQLEQEWVGSPGPVTSWSRQYPELALRCGMNLVPVHCHLLRTPFCLLPGGVEAQCVVRHRGWVKEVIFVDVSPLTQGLALDFFLLYSIRFNLRF